MVEMLDLDEPIRGGKGCGSERTGLLASPPVSLKHFRGGRWPARSIVLRSELGHTSR